MRVIKTTDELQSLLDNGVVRINDNCCIECDVPFSGVGEYIVGIEINGNLSCLSLSYSGYLACTSLFCGGNLYCGSNLVCDSNLRCEGNVICEGPYMFVRGYVRCCGDVFCKGNLQCNVDLNCLSSLFCGERLQCCGDIVCEGDLICKGDFYCQGNLSCKSNVVVNGVFFWSHSSKPCIDGGFFYRLVKPPAWQDDDAYRWLATEQWMSSGSALCELPVWASELESSSVKKLELQRSKAVN